MTTAERLAAEAERLKLRLHLIEQYMFTYQLNPDAGIDPDVIRAIYRKQPATLAADRWRAEYERRDRADKAEAERDVLAAKLARVEKVLVPYMVANGVRPDDPPVEIQRIHIRASEIRAALRSDR